MGNLLLQSSMFAVYRMLYGHDSIAGKLLGSPRSCKSDMLLHACVPWDGRAKASNRRANPANASRDKPNPSAI